MSGAERVLDRIAALLAKAERTEHAAEAETYLAKAQALATQASVDLAVARARTARREAREQPTQRTITIGERAKRANKHLVTLFVTVGHCNGLQVDVAHNSTYVIAYGMPSDLDLSSALFGSLATQMTASANAWLAVGQWRDDTYISREGWRKPHTSQTARAAFYRGFIERIGRRLTEARDEVMAAAQAEVVEVAQDIAESGTTRFAPSIAQHPRHVARGVATPAMSPATGAPPRGQDVRRQRTPACPARGGSGRRAPGSPDRSSGAAERFG
jgi:hypothetical protein